MERGAFSPQDGAGAGNPWNSPDQWPHPGDNWHVTEPASGVILLWHLFPAGMLWDQNRATDYE